MNTEKENHIRNIFFSLRKFMFDNELRYSISSFFRGLRKRYFKKVMDISEGQIILDLGCGEGMKLDFPKVIGVNISRNRCYRLFVCADARHLPFKDKSIDVLFSNSLIEHIKPEDREIVAKEIERVSKRYFIQTPYRFFPIEPHYLLPFISFFPRKMQRKILKLIPDFFILVGTQKMKRFTFLI